MIRTTDLEPVGQLLSSVGSEGGFLRLTAWLAPQSGEHPRQCAANGRTHGSLAPCIDMTQGDCVHE